MIYSVTRDSYKVIPCIVNFFSISTSSFIRILSHTSCFGIIVCTVGIQISQIFGCIFSDSQISDCISFSSVVLGSVHLHVIHILVSILFLVRSLFLCHVLLDFFPGLFQLLVILHNLSVFLSIISIPSVTFAIIRRSKLWLNMFIWSKISSCILGTNLSWSLQTV